MSKKIILASLCLSLGAQAYAQQSAYQYRAYTPGLKSTAGALTVTAQPPAATPAPTPAPAGTVALPALMDAGLANLNSPVVKSYKVEFAGPAGSTVTSLAVTNANEIFSISSDNCTGRVFASGQSCLFDVTVSTATAGAYQGYLSVVASSEGQTISDESPIKISVASGAASTFTEYLGWNRDFGAVAHNSVVAPRTIQYMRTGGSALNVHSIVSSTSDFEVKSVKCTVDGVQNQPLPVVISRSHSTGDQCFIELTMSTQQVGLKSGQIQINSNDSTVANKTIALSGEVVAPLSVLKNGQGAAFEPNFGVVVHNAAPVEKTLRVHSGNVASLTVSGITVSGDFGVSAPTCIVSGVAKSLPAVLSATGDYCEAKVNHIPDELGVKTGTLQVATDGTNSPQTVTLSVEVVAPSTGPDYSNAAGAFALRKVNPNYTGPVVRVNGTDLRFNAQGVLSSTDLATFNNGAVSIWYNQAAGSNLVLTHGDGPRLATVNGKPTLVFTQDSLGLGTLPSGTDPLLDIFISSRGDSSAQNTAALSMSNRGGSASAYHILYTHEAYGGPGLRAYVRGFIGLDENGQNRPGYNVFGYRQASGAASIAVDGATVSSTSGVNTVLGGQYFDVGGAPAFNQYHNGAISEVLLFLGANSLDRSAISAEMKAATAP